MLHTLGIPLIVVSLVAGHCWRDLHAARCLPIAAGLFRPRLDLSVRRPRLRRKAAGVLQGLAVSVRRACAGGWRRCPAARSQGCQVSGIRYQVSGIIRDVARLYGFSDQESDQLGHAVPHYRKPHRAASARRRRPGRSVLAVLDAGGTRRGRSRSGNRIAARSRTSRRN